MRHFDTLADLEPLIGQPLGHSDWITIDQARVNAFAETTEDRQWIHTDPERAKSGPFGGPIVHGFFTLSLIPFFFETGFAVRETRMVVNYGLNKVRFTAPVPVGSKLRAAFKLLALDDVAGGARQLTVEVAIEREGGDKPVCVAESLARHYR
jgi:acyl dehydratase